MHANKIVGIIGDTHIPYELDGYLEFCKATFRKYRVNEVVHIGDLVDNHALSFHDSEPLLQGVTGELYTAREKLKAWYRAFPKLTLITGNHDRIPARQLRKIGMEPSIYLRPLEELYCFPKGWTCAEQIEIDGVLYHHGDTALGVNGFRKDSQERMQSTVTGHAHSNAGISATATDQELIFGMAVGCGVDHKHIAFAYGKHFRHKPILACGVVVKGQPYIEYMDRGKTITRKCE